MEGKEAFGPQAFSTPEPPAGTKFHPDINVYIIEYNGVRMTIGYEIYNHDNTILHAKAESKHCFMKDNKIVSLKKALPEFHQRFEDMKCIDSNI